MCQPLIQTCAGTSLQGQRDGGWKKSSQRLEGVDVKERQDALSTEISRVGGSR